MNSFKELLTIILAIKVKVKKQRRYDRSMVIFKLKDRNFLTCACIINLKNANEIRTKNYYLHGNNTIKEQNRNNKIDSSR